MFRYPTVTSEQLRNYADTICIICREEMNGDNQVKKLPCDHIFHKNCLRSWFQRQQTCPTCRTQVLRLNPNQIHVAAQPAAQPVVVNQQPQQPNAAAPVNNINQTRPSSIINDQQQQQQPPTAPNVNINPSTPFSAIPNIMPPFSK